MYVPLFIAYLVAVIVLLWLTGITIIVVRLYLKRDEKIDDATLARQEVDALREQIYQRRRALTDDSALDGIRFREGHRHGPFPPAASTIEIEAVPRVP